MRRHPLLKGALLLLFFLCGPAASGREDEKVFTVREDTVAVRWLEEREFETGEIKEGEPLEVILVDGEWVRVKFGEKYGWIRKDILSEKGGEEGEKGEGMPIELKIE